MPNIAPIDINEAGAAAETLDAVKQKLGAVPNIFATMAQSPAVLNAYLNFGEAMQQSSLSARVREQIALTVAAINECDYCASAHTFIAKSLKVDDAEATQNLAGHSSDPKTAEILRFAGEIVLSRGELANNSGALVRLRNAGVTDAEIVEVIAVVAINIFTNYFNHIAGTEIDFPYVSATSGRSAA